jgi:diacylglycerol kinase (ATP)
MTAASGTSDDAPDPAEAARPDDVIRQPDDIAPDKADGESGAARQVTPEGETTSMDAPDPAPRKRAALVYNPIKVTPDRLRALVTDLSAAADWAEPIFFETTVDDLGDDVTRRPSRRAWTPCSWRAATARCARWPRRWPAPAHR